jgi:hypothetical protein
MKKRQSQGAHHITIRRRPPADVDRLLGERARDTVRLRAAEPHNKSEGDLYFDPGDGRLIAIFNEERRGRASRGRVRGAGRSVADSLSNDRAPKNSY